MPPIETQRGFILQHPSMDGGDTACRHGMVYTFGTMTETYPYFQEPKKFERHGLLVRCPDLAQHPWNHPDNFTRDQLIPIVSGLYATGEYPAARRVFWSHAKRAFFCQNINRDYPGVSRKYPWPHHYLCFDTKKPKFSWADYRDPLMIDDICHLIKSGQIYFLYPVLPLGWAVLLLQIISTRFSSHHEINQILCKCAVAGPWALKLFCKMVPDWEKRTTDYWAGWRDQAEIGEMIIRGVKRLCGKRTE